MVFGACVRRFLLDLRWRTAPRFYVAFEGFAKIPMIYGSFFIMIGVTSVAFFWRRDLVVPALIGGGLSAGVYTALCLVFAWLVPQVFEMAWHTEKFLGIFILGVPLEEILYGFACGFAATAFYPFVFGRRFVIRSEA